MSSPGIATCSSSALSASKSISSYPIICLGCRAFVKFGRLGRGSLSKLNMTENRLVRFSRKQKFSDSDEQEKVGA